MAVSASTRFDSDLRNDQLQIAFVTIFEPIDITGIGKSICRQARSRCASTTRQLQRKIVDCRLLGPDTREPTYRRDPWRRWVSARATSTVRRKRHGHLVFVAGSGHATVDGGGASDSFDITRGGLITARGNGGDDTFDVGMRFTEAMKLDGGERQGYARHAG
jgi:hypothetical protein